MRRSILLAAALGTTLALTACASAEPAGDATTTDDETTAPEVTGSLVVWVDETRIDSFAPLVDQFKDEKGVDVELVQKASGDIRTEFVQQVPTGEGPDVVIGAHDWTGEFVNNGVVQPVELGDKAGEFSPVSVAAFAYDGQVYGTPYAIENIALVRNNELVSETPDTFDGLVAQNDEIDADYPILIQQGDEGDAYHMYPLQTSFGAPVFEQNADGSYSSELGLGGENGEAFAAYLGQLGEDKVIDTAIDGDKAKQAFLDGQSPYIVTGPWYVADFLAADMDVTVLPVPSAGGEPAEPFVGVQGAFISAKTENAVLANEFVVNFLGTEAVQTTLFESGGRVPALTASADAIDDPIIAGFNEAAGDSPMPSIPEMGSVWQFWGTTEVQIISGQASDPAAAWTTMVDNIQSAIDG
ncbi:sugar ABC transporter substrate-binding protein [Oerskovia flava]|uniref:sugar ABC transporter substrate-binding protein n=1 Tax=Oerskovia flava TaxID=2986422 RepID=UPI002240CC2C|nr:maltose ABC transporter substrate-binding protein [Oerskovia sp. JB1-3-2]